MNYPKRKVKPYMYPCTITPCGSNWNVIDALNQTVVHRVGREKAETVCSAMNDYLKKKNEKKSALQLYVQQVKDLGVTLETTKGVHCDVESVIKDDLRGVITHRTRKRKKKNFSKTLQGTGLTERFG
jgi:hypothetical protein